MGGLSTVIIAILLVSCCLWVSMKVTKTKGAINSIFSISIATVLVGKFIPVAGIPLSAVLMTLLITKLTDTKVWPKAVLSVVITFVLLRALVLLGNALFMAAQ
jgi:hypothetical protein